MSREKNILLNFVLYLSTMLLVIIVGISNVFADTTIDTSTWIDISGRNWSLTGLEYSSAKTFNNDVLLNNYNVTGGIYTPPNSYDYITFSFFEHNTSVFNPCNSTSKFTATFRLLFTTPSFVNYVTEVKWGNDNCSMTSKNTSSGWIDVSCIASPSTNNYTDIFVYYTDINGTQTSNLYITRNIDIACGLNTDAIINNDNANTQNIINNNNQNTQDIINSNNQNTQDIINSNKVCSIIDKSSIALDNKWLDANGNLHTSSSGTNGVSDYINIYNSTAKVLLNNSSATTDYFCYYDDSKTKISCASISSLSVDQILSFPSNAKYLRTTINKTLNKPQLEICKNGNQALDDSINSLDSTLNDDDTDGATSEATDFFESFSTNTFGLTSIITAPLNLIQSLTSSTCNDLELPLPYLNNKKLTLPCMSTIYQQYFGTFFTIYQTITYGIIAYWVCVRIFNQVKDFKNPEHDEIEVVDL